MPMLPVSLGRILAVAWRCGGERLGVDEPTNERTGCKTWVRRSLRVASFLNPTHQPSNSFTSCPTCTGSPPLELCSRNPLALTVRSQHCRASWLCPPMLSLETRLSTDTATLQCHVSTGGKQETPRFRCLTPCHPK